MPKIISLKNISFTVPIKEIHGSFTSKNILKSITFDVEKFAIVGIVEIPAAAKQLLPKLLAEL